MRRPQGTFRTLWKTMCDHINLFSDPIQEFITECPSNKTNDRLSQKWDQTIVILAIFELYLVFNVNVNEEQMVQFTGLSECQPDIQ